MKPRNLNLLHSDDAHKGGENCTSPEVMAPPEHIDRLSVRVGKTRAVSVIHDWRSACELWASGWDPSARGKTPDLIVGDVLFKEDRTTPLQRVPPFGGDQAIPSGLSHLKPLVALARALGRPIGVGVHTKNPRLWADAWRDRHPMGAYAAHEIGELAAILGDRLDHDQSLDHIVEQCIAWLEAKARDRFEEAFRLAIADYRRKLIGGGPWTNSVSAVLVMPQDWLNLMRWVDGCRVSPQPIGTDRAVTLTYADGATDCIRLASLFAEVVPLPGSEGGIAKRLWPASCFEYSEDNEDAWMLDRNGWPQFGRFIYELGDTARLYEDAKAVVGRFPIEVAENETVAPNLNRAAKDLGDQRGGPAAALAVFFQCVNVEYRRYREWQAGLAEPDGWEPEAQELVPGRHTGCGLGAALRGLAQLLRNVSDSDSDGCFYPGDVVEDASWPRPLRPFEGQATSAWVAWHFSLLERAGVLQIVRAGTTGDAGVMYRRTGRELRMSCLPAPSRLPAGFEARYELSKKFLNRTFGFPEKEKWPLARVVKDLCNGTEDDGHELYERVLNGAGPRWLVMLLREYAIQELGWSEGWPTWLNESA